MGASVSDANSDRVRRLAVHSLAPERCGPLAELVAEGVDAEQIWQELELMNTALLPWLKGAVRRSQQQRPSLHELSSALVSSLRARAATLTV